MTLGDVSTEGRQTRPAAHRRRAPERAQLRLDAPDASAERPQALVDTLVALVDLMDRADRRAALGAQAGEQHRHAGADVRALHPLAEQLRRPADDDAVRVAQDDPRAHRDELVGEEEPALEHL